MRDRLLDRVVELEAAPPVRPPLPIFDPDIAARPAWRPGPREGLVRVGVFALACLLLLTGLGSFGLWDPWETHYGAVTTNMLETHDWLSLWWGFKEKIGGEPVQGNHFFSKPILLFWAQAVSASVVGRGDWAMRLPVALLAILCVYGFYLTLSKLWSRRVGVLGAIILATSPQFFMISRQAQTDMPFVATLTMALCAVMLALFGPRERPTRRGFWLWMAGTLSFVLLNVIPQLAIIGTDLYAEVGAEAEARLGYVGAVLESSGWSGLLIQTGWVHVILYSVLLVGVLGSFAWSLRRDVRATAGPDGELDDATVDRWIRRAYLILFYVLIAQSTYAKGLLGFMLPGLILLVYLVLTGYWRVLARVELVRGVLLCLVVGLPWYVGMLAKHGYAYYQRFFIHDHFNRLSAGVHQVDSGTFEHFVKWLGVGMFPWAIFVPLTIGWLVHAHTREARAGQARLFAGLWFLCSFTLFTMSSTKFHHYIFPALPAMALLVALLLDRAVEDRAWLGRMTAVIGLMLLAVLVNDLRSDQQHIRNLMTYKYDRPLPEHLPIDPGAEVAKGSATTWEDSYFYRHTSPTLQAVLQTDAFAYDTWMTIVGIAGVLLMLLFIASRARQLALAGLALLACAMTMWSLNYYMPALTPHWSQKYLFDAYYDTCTPVANSGEIDEAFTPLLARVGLGGLAEGLRSEPKRVCEEDVISWRITWRGETYYSWNELQPISKEDEQFLPYLEHRNHGEPFYILMERGKAPGFSTKLQRYSDKLRNQGKNKWRGIKSWSVEVVNDENLYFQMIKATPERSG